MERQIEIVNCMGWVIHDEKVSIIQRSNFISCFTIKY